MADYKATDTEFTAVANAIRTKGGTSSQLSWPNGFVSAIGNIPSGSGDNRELNYTYTLPSEYQEVEYVSFPGGQFFTIPYNTTGELFIKGQDDSVDSSTLQRCVAGYRVQSNSDYDWNARLPRQTDYNRYFFTRSSKCNALLHVIDNGDNSLSSIFATIGCRAIAGSGTNNMFIGKYYSSLDVTGGSPFVGKIYKAYLQYCNPVSYGQNFTFYLVPCYRKLDDVIGFYDVINSTFYTNEGSGIFGKGPDVN